MWSIQELRFPTTAAQEATAQEAGRTWMVQRVQPAYWPGKSQYRRDMDSPDRTRKSQKALRQFQKLLFRWSRCACYSGRRENHPSSKKAETESQKDFRSGKRQNL